MLPVEAIVGKWLVRVEEDIRQNVGTPEGHAPPEFKERFSGKVLKSLKHWQVC